MRIKATNKYTGEIFSFNVETLTQATSLWREMSETIKLAEDVKDQIKLMLPKYIDHRGVSEIINGYSFRHSVIQRQTYDKTLMRQFFDEDVLDLMLIPDKPAVDRFIKENLEDLPFDVGELRKHMIDVGKPYEVFRLEKVNGNVV